MIGINDSRLVLLAWNYGKCVCLDENVKYFTFGCRVAGCWIGAAGELLDGLDGQHHIVVVGVVEAKGTAASLGRQRPLAPHRTAPLEVVGAHVGAVVAPALHTLALLPHRVVRTKHVLGVEARPMLANKRWTMSFGHLFATTRRGRRFIVVRGGRGGNCCGGGGGVLASAVGTTLVVERRATRHGRTRAHLTEDAGQHGAEHRLATHALVALVEAPRVIQVAAHRCRAVGGVGRVARYNVHVVVVGFVVVVVVVVVARLDIVLTDISDVVAVAVLVGACGTTAVLQIHLLDALEALAVDERAVLASVHAVAFATSVQPHAALADLVARLRIHALCPSTSATRHCQLCARLLLFSICICI